MRVLGMKILTVSLLLHVGTASVLKDTKYGKRNEDMETMSTIGEHGTHSGKAPATAVLQSQSLISQLSVPHVMKHHHGMPILETKLLPEERAFWENYDTTTYFSVESKHKGALYSHIALTIFAFVFIYPICLVLNNVLSSWYFPMLLVHSSLVLVGLMNYFVFMGSIPDLYPGNAYNAMSLILALNTMLQVVFAIISIGYKMAMRGLQEKNAYSNIDGRGLEEVDGDRSSSLTLYELERENSSEIESKFDVGSKASNNSMLVSDMADRFLGKILKIPFVRKTIDFFGSISIYIFNILNWSQFLYFLVYLPTGIVTFGCYGKGKTVFNLLAHFIKGGVFLSLGLLYLARYSGAFQEKGWAWNHKFLTYQEAATSRWRRWQSNGLCTMEMIESSLILFYGCTNIFMEHMANPGGAWSAKDLQHVSIAFIFIGCGLCGVLTEIKLNDWRYEKAVEHYEKQINLDPSKIAKASPGFSPNPFPILTIYWTGQLMSKHAQASALSTEIHIQWGNLFMMGTVFRFITYIILIFLPSNKNLTKPLRPITELLASFALICGGMVFMESCDPIIYTFEYYGLTSMFMLNISLGIVTLIMAWEIIVFAFKDWLVNRSTKNLLTSQP